MRLPTMGLTKRPLRTCADSDPVPLASNSEVASYHVQSALVLAIDIYSLISGANRLATRWRLLCSLSRSLIGVSFVILDVSDNVGDPYVVSNRFLSISCLFVYSYLLWRTSFREV